jgi:uncharacterized membrane protein
MTFMPVPPDSASFHEEGASAEPFYRRHMLAIVAFFVAMAFLAAPWSFELKAHAAMHGLCAQTPSHSFFFDGRALPFDGRMTGIYSGLLSTVIILVAMGRHRAAGLPSIGSGIVLLVFVAAMALDGFNSLFFDLGKWHPYTPSNEYRLLTGWMAGIGIGTVIVMLAGMTLWRRPRTRDRIISRWWLPIVLLLPLIPVRLLIGTGSDAIFYPYSLLLMASAVVAFTTLVLVTTLMLLNRENRYERFDQLRMLTAISVVIAIALILAIGGGRFWLEAVTLAPALV